MLKTLLLYSTHHHHIEERITRLSEMLINRPFPVNVKEETVPDPAGFDIVIIGAPIYIGNIDVQVSKVMKKYHQTLLTKPHAIFTLGLQDGKDAQRNIRYNFSEDLLQTAFSVKYLGGSVNEDKLNLAEKTFIKVLKKTIRRNKQNLDNFDDDALKQLADDINAQVKKLSN